jgi:DNA polymerase
MLVLEPKWNPPPNEIYIDFETYYGPGCELGGNKLSYTEYVRHPEFKVLGVGISNGGMPEWFSGTHDEIREFLLGYTDWHQSMAIAHNMLFDGHVLSEIFGIQAAHYQCTLAFARALWFHERNDLDSVLKRLGLEGKQGRVALTSLRGVHEPTEDQLKMLGLYCRSDVVGLMRIFNHRDVLPKISPEDLIFNDVILRCFTCPEIELDVEMAERIREEDISRKQAMFEALGIDEKVLSSNDKFAAFLESIGVEVPTKWSEKKEMHVPAFAKSDIGFQELLEDPELTDIMEARIESKSTQTRTRTARFIFDASGATGKLPIGYNINNSRTGRLGGGNKSNPQNLDNNSGLRQCLRAPRGYRFVTVDASQIECRLNAWHAGEENLLTTFREKGDPYLDLAKRIFGRMDLTKQDTVERFIGKQAELSLGYGVGAPKFTHAVNYNAIKFNIPNWTPVDLTFSYGVVGVYRHLRRAITASWRMADQYLRGVIGAENETHIRYKCYDVYKGMIVLPNGIPLCYPELDINEQTYMLRHKVPVKMYGAKLIENIIQALAFVYMKRCTALIEMNAPRVWKQRIVMNTHDEVSMIVREQYADDCLNQAIQIMRTPPPWAPDLPLDAEGDHDERYCK